jgi:hypothetical protein
MTRSLKIQTCVVAVCDGVVGCAAAALSGAHLQLRLMQLVTSAKMAHGRPADAEHSADGPASMGFLNFLR